jgi:hypothetical protein
MAKRITIKNNPLEGLSSDSPQEIPAGFENILIGSEKSHKGVETQATRKGKTRGAKDRSHKPQVVPVETLAMKDEAEREEFKQETSVLPSPTSKEPTSGELPDNLAQRINRLEEDNRMQNILIGIILVPLAVLALLGAAPLP